MWKENRYILKKFAKLIVKNVCWSLFLMKLQARAIKKTLQNKCFLVHFAKLFRISFLYNTLMAASTYVILISSYI